VKKGCLIVAIVVPLIILAAVGVVGYRMSRQFGLTEAPAVSHDTVVNAQTRFQAVLEPDKLNDFVLQHLPKDKIQIPSWIPWKIDELLPKILPREVALVAGSDYKQGTIDLTMFVNERRGGPAITEYLNQQNPFRNLPQIKWDPKLVQLPQRGVITLGGALSIPEGAEEKVLESWSHEPPKDPAKPAGDHLLEAVLDNRNGEIITLAASIMSIYGMDWQKMFAMQEAQMGLEIIKHITVVRLTADLAGNDLMKILLTIGAEPIIQSQLEFFTNAFAVPPVQQYLKEQMNLKLEGNFKWDAKQNALVGDFGLSGFEAIIAQQINAAFGAPAA